MSPTEAAETRNEERSGSSAEAAQQAAAHWWDRLNKEVLAPGNCTQCGACVGLSGGALAFRETPRHGPRVVTSRAFGGTDAEAMKLAWTVCPGRGVPFKELFDAIHGAGDHNPLLGPHHGTYIGYAAEPEIRRNSASGGVTSRVLIELLARGDIDGAVVLKQGHSRPDIAEPVIATSREAILEAAQSVYAVTPMLDILPEMERFPGKLAFVGLPDQVAALRMLQHVGHPAVRKVVFVAGPYTGTNMYPGAVRSFLRAKGVKSDAPITALKWRAGEWPGYLEVTVSGDRTFRMEKFYYNYLIPFFVSRYSQITPDFTNELTDMSVGDAWSPKYETKGGGYSVVVTRRDKVDHMLGNMAAAGQLHLDPVNIEEALGMHGHMLDFKKRGTFLRLAAQNRRGRPVPSFGYHPERIVFSRRLIEGIIGMFFAIGRMSFMHWLITVLPLSLVGPGFNVMRKTWKALSKPTKRKGLLNCTFVVTGSRDRWQELALARAEWSARQGPGAAGRGIE